MFSSPLLIHGGFLLSPTPVGRVDLLIANGKVDQIGKISPTARARKLDAGGCFVMPGFVQTHIHLCQTLFRGLADDLPLLDWLKLRIWPLEAAHDERSLHASTELGLLELLLGGTTSILDMGTVHHQDVIFEAMEKAGIRGFSGKAMMDRGEGVPRGLRESTRASLRETEHLAKRWHGAADSRLGYAVAPRFVLSCSQELLEGARDLATRENLLMHTHASEHAAECAAVRKATGKDNIEFLNQLGLTGERSVFAHCVHVSPRERQILAQSKTTVAHCPSANLKLGSGIADIVELKRAGVNVTFGADGAACNNQLDMWGEMRLAGLLASMRHEPGLLRAQDLLVMSTVDGATALGIHAGRLEEGRAADLIVVEPSLGGELAHDAGLVWSGRPSDVRDVIIGGQIIVRNRRCVTLDEEAVRAHATRETKRLLSRAEMTAT